MIAPLFMESIISIWIIPGLAIGDFAQLLLTIPVQFIIGWRFYRSSYKSLKHGTATMDVLVCLGTTLAFSFSLGSMAYSIVDSTHPRSTVFYETCCTLITFIALGRYLENFAKGKTSSALSALMTLKPATATLLELGSDWSIIKETEIPSEFIQVGDILRVLPGEKVPTDCTVVYGKTNIDESLITGESIPVHKGPGDFGVGGTVNGSGMIFVRASKIGDDTTLSQIVKLVCEAQMSKAPIQAIADQVAGFFVPVIIILGISTLVTWLILLVLCQVTLPYNLFPKDTAHLFIALSFCISVIVVACPW
jgi:Cu+-exporting ATPase